MGDFPTFDDYFRIGRDEALERNSKLTREVIEREGTDANIFMAAAAAMTDEVTGQLARAKASLFLDSARGQALDRLIFDRFNLPRKNAAPAVGSVSFSTTTATTGAISIPIDTKLGTSDGKQFVTTASAVFPSGSTGPVVVAVQSTQAGADQQAAIGTITSILDAITGAPSDLVVTNTVATTGAADEEEDDPYRARARLVFETARRGTLAAIRAAALGVEGVATANAIEITDALGRPVEAVQLIITDEFTEGLVNINPTPPAYETQSQVLAQNVFNALDDVRPAGIFVNVFVAQVVIQSIQLGLTFQAGVDVDATALRARAQIVGRVNGLAPGASLTIDDLIDALRRVPGLIVSGDEILSPAGDVVPEVLQAIRTSLSFVVASSVQPDQALQGSTNPDAVSTS